MLWKLCLGVGTCATRIQPSLEFLLQHSMVEQKMPMFISAISFATHADLGQHDNDGMMP